MTFKDLSIYLQKLEVTASRNDMILILAELFKKVPAGDFDKVMYLLQGRVAPLFVNLEFGMADKMIIKALAVAYGIDEKIVSVEFKKIGDIGELAEKLSAGIRERNSGNSIDKVFGELEKVANISGIGSVDKKVDTLSNLFKSSDPLSCRYIARIPVAKLRLGFSDMTVLDSLSWMITNDKSLRPIIERAYNIRPDLGYIGKLIKEKGVEGLNSTKPSVGTPILMARAERLSSGQEIIDKIGECAVEPKYDGFRLQAHIKKVKSEETEVKLFTRNLEEVTFMYPDIVAGLNAQIDADEVIMEGEAIAYNPNTNEYLPFQLTSQRKRKYDIEEMARKIPLKYMAFDLLYLDGENYIQEPYIKRHETLSKLIREGKTLYISQEEVFDDGKKIENFFDDCISRGLEGILAKKLDGTYQAGARGWNWIKLKRSYQSKLNDTVDCVVMGFNRGQGKRTSFGIGAFLIGIYDEKRDMFATIAKVGTGLTDEEWRDLAVRADVLKSKEKPALYDVDKWLEPDFWITSEIVVEIRADELTRSPVHTAGRVMKASKSGSSFDVDVPGYALRFPRLERFRDDKKPTDATTLKEVEEIFKLQKK
ncbi:MAG: ATP-dependent DNA ligase [Candidatus Levybacteria bacterium]|nr:ATP-dependent DNA ligase [Candidatus Levybacteria bacterium]